MNNLTQTSQPSYYRWLIVITVMLVAILEVLDTTIVTVSLPAMMGELGANSEQITWVVTSYIVASAIVMPLTGFLVNLLGRKKLLLSCIIGFMLSSVFCGLANSISMVVFFRILQGLFGGALIPISQATMNDTFSKKEQAKAMAIWGIGIMAAPVLGPTIGGLITEYINWRWIFFINVPICLLSFTLGVKFIPDTIGKPSKIDWLGLFLLSLGLGCLQMFLDQGNLKGWFESEFIVIMAFITLSSLSLFFIRARNRKNNVIKIELFKNKTFAFSTILLAIYCAAIFGVILIQPIWMESLMGYPVITTGILAAPRGIACAITMGMVAPLMKRFGIRPLLAISAIITCYSVYIMTNYTLNITNFDIIWPGVLQGIGMAFFFVPLSATALNSVPKEYSDEGAGLFGYGRMLGTSIGVSLVATFISRQSQYHWNRLSEYINPFNINYITWLKQSPIPEKQSLILNGLEISRQASMMSFLDSFVIVTLALLCLFPLILPLKEMD